MATELSPREVGFRVDYDLWTDEGPRKDGIVAHYNGGNLPHLGITTTEQFLQHLRSVERFHIDIRGWRGFAYGWAFGPNGEVARGRGLNLYAAHTGDVDQDGIPDNHEKIPFYFPVRADEKPTQAMLKAALLKRIELEDQLGTDLRLFGHREIGSTACPGEPLMSWVRSNRESAQRGTPIIGPPSARLGQAVQWAIVKGATEGFLDAQGIAWMEAPRVGRGVDPVAVAAVMAHETAFGRYGGVVPESFNNWGGIKTTSGGSDTDPDAHARFPSRRAGVLAVIEHLHLYAAGPVPFPHDPRHFDRLAGIAPTFEDPDYQWGHDPRRIVALMKEIQSQTPGSVDLWIDRNGWPSYARDAIAWAIDRGLFLGHETGDGRREFRPDEPVTRAQLAVVLQRLQSPS